MRPFRVFHRIRVAPLQCRCCNAVEAADAVEAAEAAEAAAFDAGAPAVAVAGAGQLWAESNYEQGPVRVLFCCCFFFLFQQRAVFRAESTNWSIAAENIFWSDGPDMKYLEVVKKLF